MIEKLKKNWQPAAAIMTVAIIIALLVVFADHLPKAEPQKPDPNKVYQIYLEKDPLAPLVNETYYCAYYELDDRHLVLYNADSTVQRDMVLNISITCSIKKVQ